MINSEKKIKKLVEAINKDNNITITDTIELLRKEKPFEGAIGLEATYLRISFDS